VVVEVVFLVDLVVVEEVLEVFQLDKELLVVLMEAQAAAVVVGHLKQGELDIMHLAQLVGQLAMGD
jgi:hypothetical protein